ncbi:sigma-70 family RNA polymerase sigma factor [Streptosporangium subroseum]|uniref:sigma-70 family RNA polymerase sigma factor n=1 Tax=Streptosporangium subroseum TaxID=106412 RepID=UPI000B78FB65|nr:sigma-70 family RNA polymerase sigma factor [Streptosporangium subroseum]
MKTSPPCLPPADPSATPPPETPREHHLGTLVREHEKALLAYTEKLLNDHHLAEDIVQETLVRAWHHADRLYDSEGSVRGWLLTVARNLVIDRSRGGFHRYEVIGSDTLDVVQRDHADAVAAAVTVTEMLDSLSTEHREVLVHTYLWGRTVRETAEVLGIPVGTAKSRQHYALNYLRKSERYERSPAGVRA